MPLKNLGQKTLLKPYLLEFKKQSINPPGGDPVIGACYSAFLSLINKPNFLIFADSIVKRRQITSTHFVNLFFRAVQYIEIYHAKNENYPDEFTSTQKWKKELMEILINHEAVLEGIMLKRDTATTIYQRYAGSKIVLNAIFPKKFLKVADFGCGGNYGLPGLVKNLEFDEILDRTKKGTAGKLLLEPINISEGVAIDKEDMREASSKAWLVACSFYPMELSKSARMLILEAQVGHVKQIVFLKQNILAFGKHHRSLIPHSFDAVIMSTFLYQLSKKEQKIAIIQAKKMLNRKGIIIVQDFAVKSKSDPAQVRIQNGWFSKQFTYRTFVSGKITNWKMKEVLRWDNGRCRVVSQGEDFKVLL